MLSLLGGFAILFAGAIILSSCEGPAGPAGPKGEDGVDGVNGVDGTDGTDGVAGNAVCLECHTTAIKSAITAQWQTTKHGMSQTFYPGSPTTVNYAGGRIDCAKCHSHEGFVETAWTGLDTVGTVIPLPQVIQCKTCHDFHESLDFENDPNHAIRLTDEVELLAGGTMVGFTSNAESNLCMNCHQAREEAPDDAVATAVIDIPEHWGPHHAPQANIINGLDGYEFGGTVVASKGAHESQANCIMCHMAETADETTGGHTWMPDIEACSSTSCHPSATDFDMNGKVTEIEGLMADLATALTTAGMMVDGAIVEDTMYQADSAGAVWNYILLEEERSMGVHNPSYAEDLLNASIAALAAPTR
jgi:hypothetical protein